MDTLPTINLSLPAVGAVDEICRLHGEIEDELRSSFNKAMRIGELLTEQKAALPHGAFLPWVAEHLPFTDRTARNYMRLHRERARLKSESVSDLGSAYKLLAAPPAPDEEGGPQANLSAMFTRMGSPPDPSLVPPEGKRLWFIGDEEGLWVEPSTEEGYYFVTTMNLGNEWGEGGHIRGTRKPVLDIAIPFTIRHQGAESIVSFGRREIIEAEPLRSINPWFYYDYADFLRHETAKHFGVKYRPHPFYPCCRLDWQPEAEDIEEFNRAIEAAKRRKTEAAAIPEGTAAAS